MIQSDDDHSQSFSRLLPTPELSAKSATRGSSRKAINYKAVKVTQALFFHKKAAKEIKRKKKYTEEIKRQPVVTCPIMTKKIHGRLVSGIIFIYSITSDTFDNSADFDSSFSISHVPRYLSCLDCRNLIDINSQIKYNNK